MKYPVIILAAIVVALCAVGFTATLNTATVSAADPHDAVQDNGLSGCYTGNAPSTYQIQQGIAKCLEADLTDAERALGYRSFQTVLREFLEDAERIRVASGGDEMCSPALDRKSTR